MRAARRKAVDAFRLPTFQLIVLQGIFGSIPWNAMSFVTMWLQCEQPFGYLLSWLLTTYLLLTYCNVSSPSAWL